MAYSRVCCGSDGSIWVLATEVIGEPPGLLSGWVYKLNKDGILVQQGCPADTPCTGPGQPFPLAVASNSQLWALNGGFQSSEGVPSNGPVPSIQMPNGTWSPTASDGGYLDIAAAPDGTVCALQQVSSGCRTLRFDGNNTWIVMTETAPPSQQFVRIAVASATLICAVDNTGNVFGYSANPASWNALPQVLDSFGSRRSAISIAAGSDGHVWVVADDDALYMLAPGAGNWRREVGPGPAGTPPPGGGTLPISGALIEIAGTDAYHLVGLTATYVTRAGLVANYVWICPGPPGVPMPTLPPPPLPVANFGQNPMQPFQGGVAMPAPAVVGYNQALYLAFRSDGAGADAHQLVVVRYAAPTALRQTFDDILMGGAPALAVFNGLLYCAFQSNDNLGQLFVTHNFANDVWLEPAQQIPGNQTASRPALAAFNGQLYCAYQANDGTGALTVISSADGENWSNPPLSFNNILMAGAPALAEFNGALYCAFQERAPGGGPGLFVTSTTDGQNWVSPAQLAPGQQLRGAPVLAAFRGRLYCAYRGPPSGPTPNISSLGVTTSLDGANWDPPTLYSINYPPDQIGALCVSNDVLYVHFTTAYSPYSPGPDGLIYGIAASI